MTHLYSWFNSLSSTGFHSVWPFLDFRPKCLELVWPFLFNSSAFPINDSDVPMTQAVSRRVEWIQLMTQVAFRIWLRINSQLKRIPRHWFRSTHDSSGFLGNWLRINSWLKWILRYWFKSTHDSSGSSGINSNRLVTQTKKKNKWFWGDSSFDSELYTCLALIDSITKCSWLRTHRTSIESRIRQMHSLR